MNCFVFLPQMLYLSQ